MHTPNSLYSRHEDYSPNFYTHYYYYCDFSEYSIAVNFRQNLSFCSSLTFKDPALQEVCRHCNYQTLHLLSQFLMPSISVLNFDVLKTANKESEPEERVVSVIEQRIVYFPCSMLQHQLR